MLITVGLGFAWGVCWGVVAKEWDGTWDGASLFTFVGGKLLASTMDSMTKGTMFAERSGVAMVFVSTEAVAVWVSAALRDGTEDGAAA